MRMGSQSEGAEYYRQRALEEQVAAGEAACEEARRRHDELATMYRFRAAMMSSKPSSWADFLKEERSETV